MFRNALCSCLLFPRRRFVVRFANYFVFSWPSGISRTLSADKLFSYSGDGIWRLAARMPEFDAEPCVGVERGDMEGDEGLVARQVDAGV